MTRLGARPLAAVAAASNTAGKASRRGSRTPTHPWTMPPYVLQTGMEIKTLM